MSEQPMLGDEVETHRMPLLEHLRELRYRLLVSVVTVGLGMVLCLFFADVLYSVLTAPIRVVMPDAGGDNAAVDAVYRDLTAGIRSLVGDPKLKGTLAITSSPLEGVYTYLRVAFFGGLGVSAPVLAFQVWQFVAPGLYKSERRLVYPLAAASTCLFATGVVFSYLVLLPVAFPFFLGALDATAVLSVEGYLSAVVRMLLAFGVSFQLPIGVWFLARLGLIDHRDMIGGFRYAIVSIFIVAAVLTPPDILTQTVLALPLIALYGVGIAVARFATTKVREPLTAAT